VTTVAAGRLGGGTATADHPAVVMATSGAVLTYGGLRDRADRLAHALLGLGLVPGDVIAILLENRPEYFEAAWAGRRAGLYYVPINTHFTVDEVAYLLADSGARVLVTSEALAHLAPPDTTRTSLEHVLVLGDDYEALLAAQPPGEVEAPVPGAEMFYSSGTTGRPKGIRRPLEVPSPSHPHSMSMRNAVDLYGEDAHTVYLLPAPLYHAAPLVGSLTVQQLGGTVVVMERFDAAEVLRLIETHRITHGQFVPTMFVRLLRLPEEERRRFDHSSLRSAVHAAAPCPVHVKQAMMDWWGPIIHEYYNSTEAVGGTRIGPEEWLAHPGSVGRAGPELHVLDDKGQEVGRGTIGTVYFEGGSNFAYHNDPEKTAGSTSPQGWRTVGDMGYVDEAGYLFLTDRATFMIVSGGVNIYPQEIEATLIRHPDVMDVAVFGVPNEEFGEEVKAVVQPLGGPGRRDEAALTAELDSLCHSRLASYKCPRSFEYRDELPRDPNGKLYKRPLRDAYWPSRQVGAPLGP
jgi:acyl-CoA synthetase (AMP-forming)/AMP-acid ligase II